MLLLVLDRLGTGRPIGSVSHPENDLRSRREGKSDASTGGTIGGLRCRDSHCGMVLVPSVLSEFRTIKSGIIESHAATKGRKVHVFFSQ